MTIKYAFEPKSVNAFHYCPYCAEEIMEIYAGDYHGGVKCFCCEEAHEKLHFQVLRPIRADDFRRLLEILADPREPDYCEVEELAERNGFMFNERGEVVEK